VAGDQLTLRTARKVLDAVRTKKAAEKRSVKWPVAKLAVECGPKKAAALKPALDDVFSAGCVDKSGFSLNESASDEAEPAVTVELGAA